MINHSRWGAFSAFCGGAKGAFFLVFACSLLAGLFVQLVLPVLRPPWHLGNGLFIGDGPYLHQFALQTAEIWKEHGWSKELLAIEQPSLWVALLGWIYFVFGPSPLAVLPLQAACQGLGAMAVFLGLQGMGFPRVQALTGACLAGLFPTTFEWSSQLGKDGLFSCGILLCLWGKFSCRKFGAWVMPVLGVFLVFLARPNFMRPLFASLLAALFLVWIFRPFQPGNFFQKGGPFLVSACLAALLWWLTRQAPPEFHASLSGHDKPKIAAPAVVPATEGNEVLSPAIPSAVPRYRLTPGAPRTLENLGFEIYGFRTLGLLIGGRSLVDEDVFLNSLTAQLFYLPRATAIALLAPFPTSAGWNSPPDGRISPVLAKERSWKQEHSAAQLTRTAAGFLPLLMLVAYPALLGSICALGSARFRPPALLLLAFCLPNLWLLAEIQPNLGTLVRLRYPFWISLMVFGTLMFGQISGKILSGLKQKPLL